MKVSEFAKLYAEEITKDILKKPDDWMTPVERANLIAETCVQKVRSGGNFSDSIQMKCAAKRAGVIKPTMKTAQEFIRNLEED